MASTSIVPARPLRRAPALGIVPARPRRRAAALAFVSARPVRLAAALGLVLAVLLAGGASAATGLYEPNDTISAAFGPLAGGTPYNAAIEHGADVDWHYFHTAGPGVVDVSVQLTACPAGAPQCNNLDVAVVDADGGLVGTAHVATAGATAHVTFPASTRSRYGVSLRQLGTGGAQYSLMVVSSGGITTAAPDEPLPPPADDPGAQPAPPPPPVVRPFKARFQMSYVGSPKHARKRSVSALRLLGVTRGARVTVRCVKACPRRFRRSFVAETSRPRVHGLPLRIKRGTRLRIEVNAVWTVGRFRVYRFTPRGVPLPRLHAQGCVWPVDGKPMNCSVVGG